MTDSPPIAHEVCRDCGARYMTLGKKCWLCSARAAGTNPYASNASLPRSETEVSVQPAGWESTSDWVFGILLILCGVLTILVGIGFAVQDLGLLIPFSTCVVPAWMITMVRMLVSQMSDRKTRPMQLFFTFITSLAVTMLIGVLLIVAAVVSLFVICLQSLPGHP